MPEPSEKVVKKITCPNCEEDFSFFDSQDNEMACPKCAFLVKKSHPEEVFQFKFRHLFICLLVISAIVFSPHLWQFARFCYDYSARGPAESLHNKILMSTTIDEFFVIAEGSRYLMRSDDSKELKDFFDPSKFKEYLKNAGSKASVHFQFYIGGGSYQFNVKFEYPGRITSISEVRYWPSM